MDTRQLFAQICVEALKLDKNAIEALIKPANVPPKPRDPKERSRPYYHSFIDTTPYGRLHTAVFALGFAGEDVAATFLIDHFGANKPAYLHALALRNDVDKMIGLLLRSPTLFSAIPQVVYPGYASRERLLIKARIVFIAYGSNEYVQFAEQDLSPSMANTIINTRKTAMESNIDLKEALAEKSKLLSLDDAFDLLNATTLHEKLVQLSKAGANDEDILAYEEATKFESLMSDMFDKPDEASALKTLQAALCVESIPVAWNIPENLPLYKAVTTEIQRKHGIESMIPSIEVRKPLPVVSAKPTLFEVSRDSQQASAFAVVDQTTKSILCGTSFFKPRAEEMSDPLNALRLMFEI